MRKLTQTTQEKLTAEDRCDSCSAAAKVVAKFLNGELLFCGHHAKEKYPQFKDKSFDVYDPEGFLTESVTTS